jgi:hypothetical protein
MLKRASRRVTVFRLVKHIDDHYPPGADRPLPGAFRLTDADIADANRRGIPPLLSVWDHEKTTTSQAKAIRTADGAKGDYSPFAWTVADLEDLRVPDAQPLEVFEDPLPPEKGPGADGHGGISGLRGVAPPPKRSAAWEAYRQLQMELARACRLVVEPATGGGGGPAFATNGKDL